jgi:hypothetical protein
LIAIGWCTRRGNPDESTCSGPEWDSLYGMHQGTPIPWSERHKTMISEGDGGPVRTRTWDQGIMSHTDTLNQRKKVEEVQEFFCRPLCPTVPTELMPNPFRTSGLQVAHFALKN